MTENNPIDTKTLIKEAEAAEHKEAYKLLQRNRTYRIGVGARADTPIPSFFIEIIISLAPGSNEVDLLHLERVVECLKALQTLKYALTYQGGNCITCETTASDAKNLTPKYTKAISLLKNILNYQ